MLQVGLVPIVAAAFLANRTSSLTQSFEGPPVDRSPYVGCYARLDSDLTLSGSPTDWVVDALPHANTGSEIEGACRGFSDNALSRSGDYIYATDDKGLSNGSWRGLRVVDPPGFSSLPNVVDDVLSPGAKIDNVSEWHIRTGPSTPDDDLGQLFIAHTDHKLFFAIERGASSGTSSYAIEIDRNAPLVPYHPNRREGDLLIEVDASGDSLTYSLSSWSSSGYVSISDTDNILKVLENQTAVPAEPWGRIEASTWVVTDFAPHQFIEGSLDISGLGAAWSSAFAQNLGAYVQFSSSDAQGHMADITPIYGIALPHPTALGHVERFGGELGLKNFSFNQDNSAINDCLWTIKVVDPNLKTDIASQIRLFQNGKDLGAGGPWLVHTSTAGNINSVKFSFPQGCPSHVQLYVTQSVTSEFGTDTGQPHPVSIWQAIDADVSFVKIHDQPQIFEYRANWLNLVPPEQEQTSAWLIDDTSIPIFYGDNGQLKPATPLPSGSYIVRVQKEGSIDYSVSPYVSGYSTRGPKYVGFKAVVINI